MWKVPLFRGLLHRFSSPCCNHIEKRKRLQRQTGQQEEVSMFQELIDNITNVEVFTQSMKDWVSGLSVNSVII